MTESTTNTRRGWVRPPTLRQVIRGACMLLAAVSLAGCVVAPYGYYRPHPYRYYYY